MLSCEASTGMQERVLPSPHLPFLLLAVGDEKSYFLLVKSKGTYSSMILGAFEHYYRARLGAAAPLSNWGMLCHFQSLHHLSCSPIILRTDFNIL